jgi:hypothetical protein
MMHVHKHTPLAKLDKGKRHQPVGYLLQSHHEEPDSVPGNQCGLNGAQCENWAGSSPNTSVSLLSIISKKHHIYSIVLSQGAIK